MMFEDVRAKGLISLASRLTKHFHMILGIIGWHLDFDVLDQDVFPATDYLMPVA